ncbi:MAG: hypothetical protein DMG50_17590 [Acidobacteria bacterium]|nr:MAG: hypothetical protein DMG50_17590 [Acidobacteriota bacterium]
MPNAVHAELTNEKTPEKVRRCVCWLPGWFEVRRLQLTSPASIPINRLQGQREAILLVESLPADVLLMDEQTGRTIALGRNLALSGTLGVLEGADTIGLMSDFPLVLGFFISSEQQLLQPHRARRGPK